jgi:hypothetical protein
VLGDPVDLVDPFGLKTYMCTHPLHFLGGEGKKSGQDIPGNPFYHQYLCTSQVPGLYQCGGQDRSDGPWSPGKPSKDDYDPNTCEEMPSNSCIDECISKKIFSPKRPWYGLSGPGTNCQEWANETYEDCLEICLERQ